MVEQQNYMKKQQAIMYNNNEQLEVKLDQIFLSGSQKPI